MKLTRILGGIGLMVCLAGCSSSNSGTAGVPVITIDPDQEQMTAEEMAQHFTNDRLVVLRGVMLGRIDRIIDWGDRFVIFDHKEQQAVIFDTTGNCIAQIKRLGKGPGEYVQVSDCTIDNVADELVLYADQPGKLLYFDRMGRYLREERMSDCFSEIVSAGDNLYAGNCGEGRGLAEWTVTRMSMKDKSGTKTRLLSHDKGLPNVSAGNSLSTNGNKVWLCRPFDYTLYVLDEEAGQFVPCYELEIGKVALPKNEIKQEMNLQELRGKTYHIPNVGQVGSYVFVSGIGQSGYYMIDIVSGQVMKIGMAPLFGLSNAGIGGYGLVENQNRRIVHRIPVQALEYWSEELKNKGETNAELDSVLEANAEGMNPVLLFQEVK